jgi:hypothetical protein
MGACTSSAGAATVAEPGEPSARTVSLDSLRGKAVDGLVYNVSPTANHLPRPESRFQSSRMRRDSHDSVESCSSRAGWRRGGGETPRRATLKSFLSNERDARESEGDDTLTSENISEFFSQDVVDVPIVLNVSTSGSHHHRPSCSATPPSPSTLVPIFGAVSSHQPALAERLSAMLSSEEYAASGPLQPPRPLPPPLDPSRRQQVLDWDWDIFEVCRVCAPSQIRSPA